MKFRTDKIEGGIRFTAPDGWVDLLIDGERANLWCGTFNGTPPEVFGNRLWHLLKEVLPELQIRVVAYDGDTDPFVEQILTFAGFSKDGTRRQWAEGGQDQVLYSILASEVKYEASDFTTGDQGSRQQAEVRTREPGSPQDLGDNEARQSAEGEAIDGEAV